MLTLFGKKKITEEKLANAFVNSILDSVDNGFEELAGLMMEDPDFVLPPNFKEGDSDKFLITVIVGNLRSLKLHFDAEQENRMKFLIIEKFSNVFGMESEVFYKHIKDYSAFLSRVNHPSKNTIYGMSKTFFFKYNLCQYQEKYFKDMNTPNPLILKRLDEIMVHFLWDWSAFFEKYKVAS